METKNEQFVAFLRDLADFYEAHTDLPEPYWLADDVNVYLPERTAKEMLAGIGSFTKQFSDDYFHAVKPMAGGRNLVFKTSREGVCTKRVVGTKHVEAHTIPSSYVPEQIVEAHDEEIVEWDCEPVLRPS